MHERNCSGGHDSNAGEEAAGRSCERAEEELADVDQLMKCPQCGSGEHVEIAQAPSRGRGDWVGSCSSCAVDWPFTDA